MVRNGLVVLLGVAVLVGLALPVVSAPGEDAESKLRNQLAVQMALQQGRDNLQRGNYQAAVYCLESQVARVDGNREYMNALREAYRGYVRELRQAHRDSEARTYQERLKILDPGYQLELNNGRSSDPPTIAALASQTAAPPPTSKVADTAGPKPGAGYTARPQMPDDPFDDGNSARQHQVRDLLDRAKQEFERKNYASANRLYEEAHRLDDRASASVRDLWAYCKLFGVVDTLNKPGGGLPENVEKEVQMALALTTAPKLESYGKDLLREIQKRRSGGRSENLGPIEVRHIPPQPPNWAVAETANFRVLHNQPRELAEQVARVAETTRAVMTRKWFGEEPAPWDRKCTIVLYANAQHYARDTGKPQELDGHSTMKTEGDRVLDRRIDLHCDVSKMLTKVLPHETTHVVLAGRFGRHILPRGVDEGMAVLSEPREQIDLHLRNLPMHRYKREVFSVKQLLTMEQYPERSLTGAFYAQSVSLVEFLASQKGGPQGFTRFVRDGLDSGYEAALRRHYGFKDFTDLEQRWSQYAFSGSSGTAAMYRAPR